MNSATDPVQCGTVKPAITKLSESLTRPQKVFWFSSTIASNSALRSSSRLVSAMVSQIDSLSRSANVDKKFCGCLFAILPIKRRRLRITKLFLIQPHHWLRWRRLIAIRPGRESD
jgi:hypothetical protein